MSKKTWRAKPCFYVSVADWPRGAVNPIQFGLAAGPFRTHQEALDLVEPARRAGEKADPWAAFYAWGTVKMKTGKTIGQFNDRMGIRVAEA